MGKDGPGQDHNTVHAHAADSAPAAAADAFDRAWETLTASSASAGTDAPSTSVVAGPPAEPTAQPMPQPQARTRADVQRDLDAAVIGARQWNAASVDVSDDTADLLLLALRLQDELPRDLPDPAFRSALLAQLLDQAATEHAAQMAERRPLATGAARAAASAAPVAATPSLPTSGSRRMAAASAQSARSSGRAGSQPRFSTMYMRTIAALAVVMVAAISVGTMAIWMNDDDSDTPGNLAAGQQTATAQVAFNTISAEPTGSSDVAVTETTSAVGGSAQDATTPANSAGLSTASDDPTATLATERTPVPNSTAVTTTEAAPTTTVTIPAAPAQETATAVSTASGQPTVILLANVPPIDAAHVEQGPVPAASGSGPTPPRDDTSVMLETTMPTSEASAPLYRLSPPAIPPAVLVQEVANVLGIAGEAFETQGVDGGTEWAVSDDSGAHFQWDPVSGSFSFSAASDDDAPTSGISPSEALDVARQWLESIGYPAGEMTTAEPSALDPTLWVVNLGVDTVPHPGLGHPIGVTAHVDLDGNVVSASGYWLTLTLQEDAPLITLQDAWTVIKDCKGIWTGGGIVVAGGDFRVDSIDVSYLLTTLGDSKLVLQPVYRATGEFTAADGSSARVSVYVQAVRGR